MQNNYKPLNGYIEGYYGRLLNWEERDRIIVKLRKNKNSFYFLNKDGFIIKDSISKYYIKQRSINKNRYLILNKETVN